MKFDAIMDAIKDLSYSQGFYGRLYRAIMESDNIDAIKEELEAQNFGDVVDMVLYFET